MSDARLPETSARQPERNVRAVRVVAVRGAQAVVRPDRIVGEEPMEIRAVGPDGRPPVSVAVTMRTPGHDAELAVGFMVTEGLIRPRDVDRTTIGDIATVSQPENEITVHLARALDPAAISARNFAATASCGICGKASLDQVVVRCDPLEAGPLVTPAALIGLPGCAPVCPGALRGDRRDPCRGAVRRVGPPAPAARGRRAA